MTDLQKVLDLLTNRLEFSLEHTYHTDINETDFFLTKIKVQDINFYFSKSGMLYNIQSDYDKEYE